jgi:hypothetical protein
VVGELGRHAFPARPGHLLVPVHLGQEAVQHAAVEHPVAQWSAREVRVVPAGGMQGGERVQHARHGVGVERPVEGAEVHLPPVAQVL